MQPYIKKNRFYNNSEERSESFLSKTLVTFAQSLFNRKKRKPESIAQWAVKADPISCSIAPMITWIGHATFLIQVGGINIITDPIFGNASFLYSRILPPGIPMLQLPTIDFALLSHNHRDHMDEASLLFLKQNIGTRFLVPSGDKKWFDRRHFGQVKEYTWWQQESFSKDQTGSVPITLSFLPAHHWSQRGLLDKNCSLWGSWMIECNGYTIYFGGDTAYAKHFSLISNEFKSIQMALLPIGPCEPQESMCHSHMNADQAGHAFIELNAQCFVPMHWGTFHFGTDHFETPILRLKQWWDGNSNLLNEKKLSICKIGECLLFN